MPLLDNSPPRTRGVSKDITDMKHFPSVITFLALASCLCSFTQAQQKRQADTVTVTGLIIPRDSHGIFVRNREDQFPIAWDDKTRVALEVNTRLLKGLSKDVLRYRVHSSNQTIDFRIPPGPITGIVTLRGGGRVASALKVAMDENWIPERGLALQFGKPGLQEQLPTKAQPRFVGLWDPTVTPRTLSINGRKYEVSLKKGGQSSVLLFGVIGLKDCKPFVNRARVIGRKENDLILAEEIHIGPIGDQTAGDDPKLPRYLFIGDSISGNYNRGLRKALDGQFNIHHPPTNCGPSGKGKTSIVEWLGGYSQKSRHWDVISFNFGHWDAGNDKATYQANLEAVIHELKKTGAKLVWVTTCPVPRGFPPAGDLTRAGKAPRRTSGVMQKYLNPWAKQVIGRHPEIAVCDQWQFVKDHEDDTYQKWWTGKNVHFKGRPSDALGELLAEHVRKVLQDN